MCNSAVILTQSCYLIGSALTVKSAVFILALSVEKGLKLNHNGSFAGALRLRTALNSVSKLCTR